MPPAKVMPPIPTEPASPSPVTRPRSPVAVVYWTAVAPLPTHAVRPSSSIFTELIPERSMTRPPSQVP
jgi:hypothetical protein